MRIPFVDLTAQYHAHREQFDAALAAVIEKRAFIGGDFVAEFERRFAEECGVRYCVSCANGTDAIYLVLRMLDIGPGDEVVTTASSWISTSETISQTGATPIFVDVDEYYGIDVAAVESHISERTRAILPVHLYGQPVALDELLQICSRHDLYLIEDCAQAHFASYRGRRVGTCGIAGTFSFYPGKNLGAWGDAGAVVTDDEELAMRCRRFANHGALTKHLHEIEGVNSRMDGLQASLLSAKLDHIHDWTDKRRLIAAKYDECLRGLDGLMLPRLRDESTHVYHLYVIQTDRRDELRRFLAESGIDTQIHYPTALPLLPAYRRLGHVPSDFPNAVRNSGRILSLPLYPEMTINMVEVIADRIRHFFGRS